MSHCMQTCENYIRILQQHCNSFMNFINNRPFVATDNQNYLAFVGKCYALASTVPQVLSHLQQETQDCKKGFEEEELRRVCTYGYVNYWHNPTVAGCNERFGPFVTFLCTRMTRGGDIETLINAHQLERADRVANGFNSLHSLLNNVWDKKG